ncbi:MULTISPECIES: bifunctional serine/threonine-protein kinase/ABC transporter substrate-binding protein [Nostoc]|uniref:non-specific serine/threonine protein kinase n=1 Tax=Nostoc paludosum FACHB-159 TaxID=2692908 RepID=A0ABR8KDF7_9NOSO|nr:MULTISPECIES: bifunctional serine/threonine-protein kinase/ABC transporter substrate-binding protein [Nostoc]MBD2680499.1 ABC transporter substrate-binding protein [Nostoc sp. FACHB-857]MBD2736889.1 ABC transporter substrate-binding protein [Nostoc paludosum FACHB-159]
MSYCLNPNCPNPADLMNANGNIFCRNCGASLLLENKYRVINLLGSGGFSRTFEVEDNGTKKVLKVLNLSLFNDSDKKSKIVNLFQREAEVLIRLNHSGIPQVEPDGYFELNFPNCPEPLYCLVMEKIEGLNLQQWLKNRDRKPITLELAIAYLKQILEILQQVHAQGYFHRDIKPANIMVKPDGKIVLIDFGAVRDLAQTYVQEENENTIVGTLGYSSPEQMKGTVVKQSDFFALGRTFVHLLTGKPPLNLEEDHQTGKLIWRDQVIFNSNYWRNWLEKLRWRSLFDLLDEMMEPYWKNRPENTQVILRRLNHPITLPRIPPWIAGTAILFGIGLPTSYWYFNGVNGCSKIWLRNFTQDDRISCGEQILLPNINMKVTEKEQGVKAIAAGNYQDAITWLEKAWQKDRDPETLIYLNNSRLEVEKINAYTIAVVAPLGNNNDNINSSKEILRGVAQAQNEFNQKYKTQKIGLKVLIASDNNQEQDAQKIAKILVNQRDVIAVIGHFRSDTTLVAVKVYQEHNLLLVSATATSESLSTSCKSNHPNCFFRVVPSNRVIAQTLADYLKKENKLKAAIFFNPNNNYSKSLQGQIKGRLSELGGKVVVELPLYDNIESTINQVKQQKANVIVLLPTTDGLTSDSAVQVIEYAKQNKYLVVGGDSLDNNKLLKALVGNQAGAVVAIPWHSRSNLNRDFPQKMEKTWEKTGTWYSALSYDATRVLLAGLEKTPSSSRENLQQAIAQTNFKASGATGLISFKPNGDRQQDNIHLVKIVQNPNTGHIEFIPLDLSNQFPGD